MTRIAAGLAGLPDRTQVVVIGLGVTGAGVALDAATRGLDVVAVDAHDLGVIGGIDFADLKITLPVNPTNPKGAPAVIEYGAFINVLIQFVIVAFVIFMMVKLINKLRRQQAAEPDAAPAAPTATEQLLIEIRDELKARP